VIEQAIDTAAAMPGTDKSRGYCLEMMCGTSWRGKPGQRRSIIAPAVDVTLIQILPCEQRQAFLHEVAEKAS
jgi:hypothetical protein